MCKVMMEKKKILRIGTRGSQLALKQTALVIEALQAAYPEYEYQTVVITTEGDKKLDRSIGSFGGKAVFVEAFEQALVDGQIHLAVHSAKDMPNPCGKGLCIAGTLPRACVQDVLIYRKGTVFSREDELVVGTGSMRRRSQLMEMYPKARCADLRGNIGTRIEKLRNGKYDAIILAAAGIERQGLDKEPDLVYEYLSVDQMLPAAGQGIIAIESREDSWARKCVSEISHQETQQILMIERAVLTRLQAGCHEPVGVLAQLQQGQLKLQLMQLMSEGIKRRTATGTLTGWEQVVEELTG